MRSLAHAAKKEQNSFVFSAILALRLKQLLVPFTAIDGGLRLHNSIESILQREKKVQKK